MVVTAGCLFVEKIENKVFDCFSEITTVTKSKILSATLFRKLVPAFRQPPVTLKFVPESRL
jgi:hypothetical protein